MLSIIISACLASNPGVCKDYRIPLAEDIDAAHCALYAPPHFAAWVEEHPGWQIKRWQCTNRITNDL
jgi:hypothetical protein